MSGLERDKLDEVRAATARLAAAERSYREAIVEAAFDPAISYADIAAAAGRSRQTVRELVLRARGEWPTSVAS
jgi:DNA-directed RNA polymerase specialized sigma24 family protein